jgi:hypothetical protein
MLNLLNDAGWLNADHFTDFFQSPVDPLHGNDQWRCQPDDVVDNAQFRHIQDESALLLWPAFSDSRCFTTMNAMS